MMIAVFFLLAAVCIAAVMGMILSKTPSYSALFLVLMFAALGGLFGLLGAPFMAVVQVIIYAGAIMVLFIFLIMTVHPEAGIPAERRKGTIRAGILLAAVLAVELVFAALNAFAAPAPLARRP